jgi:protein-disulfide isomerase
MSDEQSKKNLFEGASPKLTFLMGLILGLAIVSLLGFLIVVAGSKGGRVLGSGSGLNPSSTSSGSTPTDSGSAPQDIRLKEVTSEDHIRGDVNAPITLVEYSDLECPFCKRFHPTMQRLISEYKGKVRWVYRHFPLTSLHSKAIKEAEATECAAEQGKFWEYTDRLFEVTPSNDGLPLEDLPKIARDVGVKNITQFQKCLDSGKYAQKVNDHYNDATQAGGQGTPYTVVIDSKDNKIPISGAFPYEDVKNIVDGLLK